MTTPLLKQAIESRTFIKSHPYIGFLDHHLFGALTVNAQDRVEMVNLMFAKNHETFRYSSSEPTNILIEPKGFALASFGSHLEDPAYFYKEALGYTVYQEEIQMSKKIQITHVEEIKTVFKVKSGKEIAGFYDFDLSVSHKKGQAMMILNLEQIFVKPEFRGSTYWMDLAIAVTKFVGSILYCLSEQLPKIRYFDVYVKAIFLTKSDEKIAKFIFSEIRALFEELPELTPNRPTLIGEVIADMGY